MAFHVACPITCRKICFCALGFAGKLRSEKGKNDFLQEVARVEQFLNDPWLIKAKENATIQVKVPKVVVSPGPAPPPPQLPVAGGAGDEAAKMAASAHAKRAALQKQAAAASMVAEDYARKFESGDLVTSGKDVIGEEQGNSNVKVMCRLCFSGENEGSGRARKMLSCSTCGKKYHRNCLKVWSQNRDLFHWSSWACPSCRTCEVCRRTGDPNKFMFCKRCDGAYHCYCQQPPHKNVGHGPYLCPKHTKCHSCGSSVPGNGLSVRWFLGYTCCDACGRLFVKGNYCPVCLKVYRDSESTPMVCCDICQRWVHCPCDGISDAKYMQFQVDRNLQYVCPTCRGECSQVRNLEEAVQELWRRRDEADKDLIASLRAAAGLPTQEEIFDISPFSDDEDSGPVLKNEHGRSLKFPLKALGDKSPKKSKEHGKKSSKKHSKKKGNDTSLINVTDANLSFSGHGDSPFRSNPGNNINEDIQSAGDADTFYPVTGSVTESASAVAKHKHTEEVTATSVTKASRTIRIKSNNSHGPTNSGEVGTNSALPKAAQGPKLVIHLGGRTKNTTQSEASGFKRGQGLTSSNVGAEDTGQPKRHGHRPDAGTKHGDKRDHKSDHGNQVKGSKPREKEGHLIKLQNTISEHSNVSSKPTGGELADGSDEFVPLRNKNTVFGKRVIEETASARSGSEASMSKQNRHSSMKDVKDRPVASDDNSAMPLGSQSSSKDHRPHLRFKIPKSSNSGNQISSSNINTGNQNSLPLPANNEKTYTRGQRSKRKRPAALGDEDSSQWHEDNTMDLTDANWILQKLGKDAAGKRVEIYQSASNSWHRGTVMEVFKGTSMVSISLDGGQTKSFELGKQGIRFISQKAKATV